MASFKQYTASGGASEAFSIKSFSSDEINVRVDGVLKTAATHYNITSYTSNGGTVTWTSGNVPSSGTVRIYRLTDLDPAQATFQTGSSLKANDLNDNQTQVLRALEEAGSRTENLVQNWDIQADAVTTTEIKDETIVNANISPTAEIQVSKLKDGTARQLLQTDSAGTGVEWADNIDIPGTLDVALDATFDSDVVIKSDSKHLAVRNAAGTAKFLVNTSTGETTISGPTVLSNTLSVGSTLTVTGDTTLNGNVAANSGTSTLSTVDINGGAIDGTVIGANSPATGSFTTINASGAITGNVTGDLTGKASELSAAASVTSGEQSGYTANNTSYYTTAASDARYYNIGSTEEIVSSETWVSDDSSIATTKAVDNRVINLVDEVGGFVPITDESDFPATNPDINSAAGTIVSVGTLTTSYTPSTGTVTIPASTLDNLSNDLTITGCGSTVLAAGFGVLVETKALSDAAYASSPSYTFHRLTPKSSEVTTVAGISSNITTVAGISSNVTTVAGISSDVTAVAGKTTEIGRLGTADAVSDMNTLGTADVVSDLNTLGTADVVSDLDTVAGIASNVTTVAGVSANVTTVAGISANVTTVAGKASDVTAVAGKITEVETVADNLTAVENFNDTYQIDDFSPSAPTTDGGGNALAEGDLAYDTTNDKLKVWTGSAWETGVEGHTNLMARAGGTFTGDVTWDNSTNAGKDMFWDESDDTLKLNDDVQISLGSDRDIRLYHTGTHGYINVVTGDLNIRTNGTESAIIVKPNAGVELYYDDSQKLTTTTGGIDVTGTVTTDGASHGGDVIFQGDGANSYWDKSNDSLIFNDNAGVNLGTDRDVRFYFDGSHAYMNVVTGDLNIRTSGTESAIICTKDAGVATYYNGNKKTETTNTGIDITGNIVVSGTVDGRDLQTDGTKLDGIEASATADQTNAEIRAAVEAATDSNVFTDADHTKLNAIEASATADQTDAEIRAAVEAATDSNVFTDADHTKLNGIEASADVTDATNVDAAGAIMHTDLGTKGQIVVGDGSGDATILGVGTNTHVLTADSSEASGVKWAATATGTPEGTAILSTGETGGTKFLREDGDNSCSWQSVPAGVTQENVEDWVGGMVTGNTETGITVTYEDGDGTLDFVVASQTDENFTTADHSKLDGIEASADVTDATNVNAAGAIMEADVDAKGDILAATADNTVARLAVGSNTQVLTADSSTSTGLAWAAASVGTITALNNQAANRLTTIGSTTTQLDGEASLTFEDTTSTGLISGKQITGRGFECPATVSDDWTIAAGNNAMFPGPMTVAATKTVTVPANRTLTIV